MKNKIYAFGFLVAALIIAPNAAFGQNYDVNHSMKPTAIITSNDSWVGETDSQSTRESQSEIRSGSLCSSGGKFRNNQASNRGGLVASTYNRSYEVSRSVPIKANFASLLESANFASLLESVNFASLSE